MVPSCPLFVFNSRDFVPQSHSVSTFRALWSVRINVVPSTVLKSHCEDVHDRVIKSFARSIRIHFLWIVRTSTNHVVSVVRSVDHDIFDIVEVFDHWLHFASQVDQCLRLILCRVFFCVSLKDCAFFFANFWKWYFVFTIFAVKHVSDNRIFTFINWRWSTFATHNTVHSFNS